jgi:hypothetical protein
MGALLNEKAGSRRERHWHPGAEGWRTAEFNKKYTVGTLNNQETRYITNLCTRFYQYGRRPVPARWSRI